MICWRKTHLTLEYSSRSLGTVRKYPYNLQIFLHLFQEIHSDSNGERKNYEKGRDYFIEHRHKERPCTIYVIIGTHLKLSISCPLPDCIMQSISA
jgi:hypothetical protein